MHRLTARPRWCATLAIFACEIVLAAAALSPGRMSAQTTFRGGVDLVEADAIVLDAKGQPVPGLTAADFTLSVDGRLRAIESVHYVDAGMRRASHQVDAARSPHDAASPPVAPRHIVFVIDEGNIS